MDTVQSAQKKIVDAARGFGEEVIPLEESIGRTLSEDIKADRNYPPFNRATMDGYAININDFTHKGIKEYEIADEVFAGKKSAHSIPSGSCIKIMTGAPVPVGLNAVIRIEDTEQNLTKVTLNIDSISINQNIAIEGEDAKYGEIIIPKNTFITPPIISSLAVVGKVKVKVYKNPRIVIISTGDEIKNIKEVVELHQIRDSNSHALEAFLTKYNISNVSKKIIRDNKVELTKAVKEALDFDIIITSGGVSMGDADFLPSVFEECKLEKVFHKVEVKPGKPIWFGKSQHSVVFGLPGNPVSVQVACKIFLEPYIRACFGLSPSKFVRLPLRHSKKKKTKFDEYFPCSIDSEDPTSIKMNTFNGSGDVTATIYSDGVGLHEAAKGDIKKGDLIDFYMWNL